MPDVSTHKIERVDTLAVDAVRRVHDFRFGDTVVGTSADPAQTRRWWAKDAPDFVTRNKDLSVGVVGEVPTGASVSMNRRCRSSAPSCRAAPTGMFHRSKVLAVGSEALRVVDKHRRSAGQRGLGRSSLFGRDTTQRRDHDRGGTDSLFRAAEPVCVTRDAVSSARSRSGSTV